MKTRLTVVMWIGLVGTALWARGEDGAIRGAVAGAEGIVAAWAIERQQTPTGVYHQKHAGGLVDGKFAITNLPVPGRYDLRFDFTNGYVEGWDATVPKSDYEEEQPLKAEAIQAIAKKMSSDQCTGFGDEALILDIQGNIQNAAVLLMQLRQRPFVGGGYQPGEWVWRIDRWQWEDPDERTWVPYQERPFYALVRERLYAKDYRGKNVLFARHLGGIVLDKSHPEANLGTLRIPRPVPGIHAAQPDGTQTSPITLKAGPPAEGATP
jgi:hypothetical protein